MKRVCFCVNYLENLNSLELALKENSGAFVLAMNRRVEAHLTKQGISFHALRGYARFSTWRDLQKASFEALANPTNQIIDSWGNFLIGEMGEDLFTTDCWIEMVRQEKPLKISWIGSASHPANLKLHSTLKRLSRFLGIPFSVKRK